ncbi:MAG: dihydroneopterin aldolase [Parachlamydiaceae bacterium]
MLDEIQLEKFRVMAIVGQGDDERLFAQPLEFTVTLFVDLSKACESDDLNDTVDYGAVCRLIEEIVQHHCDHLLEKLAARVSEALLHLHHVKQVTIKLKKLRVPVPSDLGSAAVVIHREKSSFKTRFSCSVHQAILD